MCGYLNNGYCYKLNKKFFIIIIAGITIIIKIIELITKRPEASRESRSKRIAVITEYIAAGIND